ncbi:MAG: hypothetical protein FWE75_23340, partial [Actinomycetia bacterium]|nr:hypothetical protein [Actinomycetes bacterium]
MTGRTSGSGTPDDAGAEGAAHPRDPAGAAGYAAAVRELAGRWVPLAAAEAGAVEGGGDLVCSPAGL